MNQQTLQVALIAGIATIVTWAPFVTTAASEVSCHRQRTYNRCCLPLRHYGHDDQRSSATMIAAAPVGRPKSIDQFPGEVDAEGNLKAKGVQRKIFTPVVPSLTVDHIQLKGISLAIYDTGQVNCTGVISNSGGRDGALVGNNVTLRVRAYAGPPQHPNVENSAPMLWEATRKLWVPRGPAKAISLLPGTATVADHHGDRINFTAGSYCTLEEEVRRHFDEITHLEVELEYRKDR